MRLSDHCKEEIPMTQKSWKSLASMGAALLLVSGCRVAFDDQLPFARAFTDSSPTPSIDYSEVVDLSDGLSRLAIAPQQAVLIKAMPLGLELSPEELSTLRLKTMLRLSLSGLGVSRYGDIRWTTSDPDIATVDEMGQVDPADGSSVGEVVVTAASRLNPSQRATAKVMVTYLDTSIKLLYPTATLSLKEKPTLQLVAQVDYLDPSQRSQVIGSDSSGKNVTWSSSDSAIAQVDDLGSILLPTDAATGSVTITARSNYDPKKSAAITLKVSE